MIAWVSMVRTRLQDFEAAEYIQEHGIACHGLSHKKATFGDHNAVDH